MEACGRIVTVVRDEVAARTTITPQPKGGGEGCGCRKGELPLVCTGALRLPWAWTHHCLPVCSASYSAPLAALPALFPRLTVLAPLRVPFLCCSGLLDGGSERGSFAPGMRMEKADMPCS